MRLVLLGTRSAFTRAVLAELLRLGRVPAALLMPAGQAPVPARRLLRAPDAAALARQCGIQVVEACGVREPVLQALLPDAACAACFPWRLPQSWRAVVPAGCLNLHPSLLPAYRGPAPLFWQLREDEQATGVTLHIMDEGLDTGDIVGQRRVELAEGLDTAEAERVLGEAGAGLLDAALRRRLPGVAQGQAGASCQPWPRAEDLRLDPSWTAHRARRFLRGAEAYGPFEMAGRLVMGAVEDPDLAVPPAAGEADLAFVDGQVRVRLLAI